MGGYARAEALPARDEAGASRGVDRLSAPGNGVVVEGAVTASSVLCPSEQMLTAQRSALDGRAVVLSHVSLQRALDSRGSTPPATEYSSSGLPAGLRAGIEGLSGLAMDDVRVHYNSTKPAAVNAHAYAQGAEIHLARGQEHHLPHEAWHVVQQKQGRVKPTLQVKGVAVNDDVGLEREADAMGSRALGLRIPAAKRAALAAVQRRVLQRVIKFKGGGNWAKEDDIPEKIRDNAALKAQTTSQDNYLAQKAEDMKTRASGKPAPLLTPHRHVIGERHNASRFETALENWGWGAGKMAESFQHSSQVTDKVSVENSQLKKQVFFTNPYHGTDPLENLHPYMLAGVAVLRFALLELKKTTRISENYATQVALKVNVNDNQAHFKTSEGLADQKRARIQEESDNLCLHLKSYQDACNERLKKAAGLGDLAALNAALTDKWNTLPKMLKELASRPYGRLMNWTETADSLRKVPARIDDFIKTTVDPWADALVGLTKIEAAPIHGDEKHIEAAWQAAKGVSDQGSAVGGDQKALTFSDKELFVHQTLSPVRELFMVENIKKLVKPGLVQIGEAHLEGLKNKIPDSKLHASYADFVADTNKL